MDHGATQPAAEPIEQLDAAARPPTVATVRFLTAATPAAAAALEASAGRLCVIAAQGRPGNLRLASLHRVSP